MARRAQFPSRRNRWSGDRLEQLEGRIVMVAPAVSAAITFTVSSDWGSGFGGNVEIRNLGATSISGWTVEFDFARSIDSIWNASISSRAGNRYAIRDAGYNATIAPGASVSFGFNGSPGNLGATAPTNYVLNGTPIGGSTSAPPTIAIADASSPEGNPATSTGGFLRTSGNQIVDAQGQSVRIAGVNWFGLETPNFAPHGLWTRGYKSMMDQMKQLGFNTIRLPYSSQLFDAGSTPNSIDYSKNPELAGLNGLQIIDKIVEYAGVAGLRIILDHHRSTAGNSAQESGLWYTSAYPESRWINDWVMLANRYKGNPTVIGADLHNEPHGPANWGNGDVNDWRLAAERAGNAVLAANPDWLILVEGVETTGAGSTWWGGNLSNAGAFPVRLNVPGRLVYSPHEYPASIYNQRWFSDPDYPNNLPAVWDTYWGYLFRQDTAPILIGELGSKLQTTSDVQWANKLVDYLKGDLDGNGTNDLAAGKLGASWTWWSWNPNSGDTGGILKDDWTSVHDNKVSLLAPVQFPLASPGSGGARSLAFTVSLSRAATSSITVDYSTANGTAAASTDYTATSGRLTFAAGESSKTVLVPILGDTTNEPDETLRLVLRNPAGATLADAEGLGTILNDDGATPPPPPPPPPPAPNLSIENVSVTEGNSGQRNATFNVRLSAASAASVSVAFATADGTARAALDYVATGGSLSFAPGTTLRTVVVPILGDTLVEGDETFSVRLSGPTGATLGTSTATGTIVDDDAPAPGSAVAYAVKDDWGSGFVAEVRVSNLTAAAFSDWTLEFDLAANITNIWNATIVRRVGNRYTVRAASWNRSIVPGGSVTFGFQADPGGGAARSFARPTLNGAPA